MALSTIRAEMKSILESVSGIGQVHDYQRYSKEWSTYKDVFESSDKINFVQIVRTGFSRIVHGSNSTERVTHAFVLEGAYGLKDDDASAKVVDDLVESISQVFRDKPRLNNTAEVVQYPISGDIFIGMFGNVLCHRYSIRVTIRDREVFS
jgi:hypothetical protein